jgi:hypothetical protein
LSIDSPANPPIECDVGFWSVSTVRGSAAIRPESGFEVSVIAALHDKDLQPEITTGIQHQARLFLVGDVVWSASQKKQLCLLGGLAQVFLRLLLVGLLMELCKNHFTKALRIAFSSASASNYLSGESLREIIAPLGHFNRGANLFESLGHCLDVFALK